MYENAIAPRKPEIYRSRKSTCFLTFSATARALFQDLVTTFAFATNLMAALPATVGGMPALTQPLRAITIPLVFIAVYCVGVNVGIIIDFIKARAQQALLEQEALIQKEASQAADILYKKKNRGQERPKKEEEIALIVETSVGQAPPETLLHLVSSTLVRPFAGLSALLRKLAKRFPLAVATIPAWIHLLFCFVIMLCENTAFPECSGECESFDADDDRRRLRGKFGAREADLCPGVPVSHVAWRQSALLHLR